MGRNDEPTPEVPGWDTPMAPQERTPGEKLAYINGYESGASAVIAGLKGRLSRQQIDELERALKGTIDVVKSTLDA